MRNVYELHSRWDLAADRDTVWDALEELLASDDPMAWWPSVTVVSKVGDDLNVAARSVLGYRLHFRLYGLAWSRPDSMTVESDGDLRGRGDLTFGTVGDQHSTIDIQWNVSVDRAWMRATSLLLRPAFTLGHHLVMAQGQKRLNRWLAMRATGSPRDR